MTLIHQDREDSEDISTLFSYSWLFIYPPIKIAINLRYLLTCHTSTLRGIPLALHPQQMHTLNNYPEEILDDNLRGCILESKAMHQGFIIKPHPIIDGLAHEVSTIVFDTPHPRFTTLAFNGASGAIMTAGVMMEPFASCIGLLSQ